MSRKAQGDCFFVLFTGTGQKFPIRFMMTSDQYEVELPCGSYAGEHLAGLRDNLKADFEGVRVTR